MISENLKRLREEAELTQSEVAKELNISAQSVSKWETDASVPELGKLVRLGQVFGVSLDELIKGEPAVEETAAAAGPEPQPVYIPAAQDTEAMAETLRSHRQKIAGIVLLAVSGVACILQIGLITLIWPLLLIGLLCLTTKRVTGLGIGWLLWLMAAELCSGYTSVNLFMVFHRENYGIVPVQVAIAWLLWLWLAALITVSVRRFRTGSAALPGWEEIGVMTAVWLTVSVYARYMFGIYFFRNPLSYLIIAALGLLTLLKLWQRKPDKE